MKSVLISIQPEWCLTDEGKQYLKGGSKYNPEHKGNIALDEALAEEGADNV